MLKTLASIFKGESFQDTTPLTHSSQSVRTIDPNSLPVLSDRVVPQLVNTQLVAIVQCILNKMLSQHSILQDALTCNSVESSDTDKGKRHRINIIIRDWSEHVASLLPLMQTTLVNEMGYQNPCINSRYSVAWVFSPIICQVMSGPKTRSNRQYLSADLPAMSNYQN